MILFFIFLSNRFWCTLSRETLAWKFNSIQTSTAALFCLLKDKSDKSPGFVDFVPREQSVANLMYSLTLGINQWITICQFVLALTATWTYRILSNLGFHILYLAYDFCNRIFSFRIVYSFCLIRKVQLGGYPTMIGISRLHEDIFKPCLLNFDLTSYQFIMLTMLGFSPSIIHQPKKCIGSKTLCFSIDSSLWKSIAVKNNVPRCTCWRPTVDFHGFDSSISTLLYSGEMSDFLVHLIKRWCRRGPQLSNLRRMPNSLSKYFFLR